MLRNAVVTLSLVVPVVAGAQVRCLMPNGVWIERKLTDVCPAGARQAQSLDGQAVPLKVPPPPSSAVDEAPPKKAAGRVAGVESKRQAMPFDKCVSMMTQTVLSLPGKTRVLAAAPEIRTIRICTSDGSVLMTCSRPDAVMVTTKSPNFCE